MREILFRGKRIDNGEWVEGFYNHIPCGRFLCDEHCIQTIKQDGRIGQLYDVYDSTVEQFTGLTDKNGKKIFEGDIILYKFPDGSYAYGIVKFRETNEVGFCVEWFNRHDSGWLRNDIGFWAKDREIEVIGNIHDNPEPLGGAEDG